MLAFSGGGGRAPLLGGNAGRAVLSRIISLLFGRASLLLGRELSLLGRELSLFGTEVSLIGRELSLLGRDFSLLLLREQSRLLFKEQSLPLGEISLFLPLGGRGGGAPAGGLSPFPLS